MNKNLKINKFGLKLSYSNKKVYKDTHDNRNTYNKGFGCDGGSFYSSIRIPRKNNKQAWKQFRKIFSFLYEDDVDGNPKCFFVEKTNGKRFFIRYANTANYVNDMRGKRKKFELL